jgi:hypothetical protein
MKVASIVVLSCLLLISCGHEKKKPESTSAKTAQKESPLNTFLQTNKDALKFKELFPAFSEKNLLAVPYSVDLDAKLDSVGDTSILFYAQLADIAPDSLSDSSFVATFISPFPFPQVMFQLDLMCDSSQVDYLQKQASWEKPIDSRGFVVVGRDISGTRPALQLHVSTDVTDPYASALSLRTPEMIYLQGKMVDALYVTNIFDLTKDTTTTKTATK